MRVEEHERTFLASWVVLVRIAPSPRDLRISIIPRGLALGVTFSAPHADRFNYQQRELSARINVALGGRAAEEIVFGQPTTGAESDIK